MEFTNIRHGAAAEQLLRLIRRKIAMLCTFAVGFEKVPKSCLVLLAALPGLVNTLLHSC